MLAPKLLLHNKSYKALLYSFNDLKFIMVVCFHGAVDVAGAPCGGEEVPEGEDGSPRAGPEQVPIQAARHRE